MLFENLTSNICRTLPLRVNNCYIQNQQNQQNLKLFQKILKDRLQVIPDDFKYAWIQTHLKQKKIWLAVLHGKGQR